MPRFFFDVLDDVRVGDKVGTELADAPSARRQAVELAAELVKSNPDIVMGGKDLKIEVSDENGLLLCIVTVMMSEPW